MKRPSSNPSANGNQTTPAIDTKVTPKAKRRGFTKAYKQRILKEAAACLESSQVGRCCGARDYTPPISVTGVANKQPGKW